MCDDHFEDRGGDFFHLLFCVVNTACASAFSVCVDGIKEILVSAAATAWCALLTLLVHP